MARFGLHRFFKNTEGSAAVMFAISAVALLGCAGAAMDYVRKSEIETGLQAAADSAALAAAAEDEANRQAVAEKYFQANYAPPSGVSLRAINVVSSSDGVEVSAEADLPTGLLTLVGIPNLVASARGVAASSNMKMEIALVLDVSGSMRAGMGSQSRIDALKTAAKRLVDIVSSNGGAMSRVKIGIVPFNMNVNIGTANGSYVRDSSNALFAGQSWAGCVLERPGTGATSDDYDGGTGPSGKWQAYVWPPEPDSNGMCTNISNGTNSGYQSLQPPSGYSVMLQGPNYNCVRHEVMALSSDYDDIVNKIDSLTSEPNMGTIIAPGVSWGMRVLSPDEPFIGGETAGSGVRKVLVVLTDGEQTTEGEYNNQKCAGSSNTSVAYSFDPASLNLAGRSLTSAPKDMFSAYGYILDSDPFGSNPSNWNDVRDDLARISSSACSKAKSLYGSHPIDVYTIAVSNDAGPGTSTYDVLNDCASKPENFFLASNDAALIKAFEDIANQVADIRLTQ